MKASEFSPSLPIFCKANFMLVNLQLSLKVHRLVICGFPNSLKMLDPEYMKRKNQKFDPM